MNEEKFKDIIEKIEKLTVLELAELVKVLEEKFNISASQVIVSGSQNQNQVQEEKSTFDVILKSAGEQKINVIKVVKEITGLGLQEAKALVDGAPKPIKEGVKKEEAEEIKKKIEEVGGSVELK